MKFITNNWRTRHMLHGWYGVFCELWLLLYYNLKLYLSVKIEDFLTLTIKHWAYLLCFRKDVFDSGKFSTWPKSTNFVLTLLLQLKELTEDQDEFYWIIELLPKPAIINISIHSKEHKLTNIFHCKVCSILYTIILVSTLCLSY